MCLFGMMYTEMYNVISKCGCGTLLNAEGLYRQTENQAIRRHAAFERTTQQLCWPIVNDTDRAGGRILASGSIHRK
jgi:hypothetical protein